MYKSNSLEALKEEMTIVLLCMSIDGKLATDLAKDLNKMTRKEFVDTLILHRTLSNDIEIRLNKFVDKRNDAYSLFNAINELKKTQRIKKTPDLDEIKKKLDVFIKTEFKLIRTRRNDTLTHLKKGSKFSYDEVSVIVYAVKSLLEIMDSLNARKINYYWSYGKQEGRINLRQLIGLD